VVVDVVVVVDVDVVVDGFSAALPMAEV